MPSLGDVANEIKAILEDVRTSSAATVNHLAVLDADLKDGFTNLAQGVKALVLLGIQSNQLQEVNNRQNEIIICWLTNIANTVCEVKHNTDAEVRLQKSMSKSLVHIDAITELVNGAAAIEVERRDELVKKLEKCCPPERDPVGPCFKECATYTPPKFEPVTPDWKPISYKNNIG